MLLYCGCISDVRIKQTGRVHVHTHKRSQSLNSVSILSLKAGLHWSSGMTIVDESSKVNSMDEPNSVHTVHQD
jgi:hypothetical protein